MDRKKIRGIVEELAENAVSDLGLELVDVDFKTTGRGYHIIVYIDKKGGVFLEDCEMVSKSLGELLDLHDPIPTSYTLEVSSPGMERPLKKRKDFLRFQGEKVKIRTIDKINGSKNFTGILMDVREDSLTIKRDKEEIKIHFENIFKANLYYKKGGKAK
ncbi:MAG TPA: ribosome maturation factor RimP [Firmicutes bacterium]|jgi:ribosome maturation factor RimP|nr:ribosome maturation factor RimP [Bacillota bacterium]